jgi:hypothetical protein
MFGRKIKKTSFFSAIACFTLPILLSCHQDSEKNKILLEALNESVFYSNKDIIRSSLNIYNSLENKMYEPYSHSGAKRWHPKAMMIKQLTDDQAKFIEGLKEQVRMHDKLGQDEINRLSNLLNNYKNDVLKIDSGMTLAFNSFLIFTTKTFESKPLAEQNFSDYFFDGLSKDEILFLLNKFENNIRIVENRLAQFCNNKVSGIVESYETYSAIVGQNTSYVRGGEQIEITAGVGAFSIGAKPDIIINGQKIPLNETGIATIKFPASNSPGKHFVPVEISFTDEDGKKQTITKTVEYTVAPAPD